MLLLSVVLTFEHVTLSKRSAVLTPDRVTSNIWTIPCFFHSFRVCVGGGQLKLRVSRGLLAGLDEGRPGKSQSN